MGRPGEPFWPTPFVVEYNTGHPSTSVSQTWPWRAILLSCLSLLGTALQAVTATEERWMLLPAGAWVVILLWLALRRPRTTTIFGLFLYLVILVSQLVMISRYWQAEDRLFQSLHIASATFAVIGIVSLLNAPFREPSWSRTAISQPYTRPTSDLRSPEDDLTPWQWMSVSWMAPLLKIGTERQLHDEDVWLLPYEFQHRYLHDAFRELSGTVVYRLIKANWIDIVLMTGFALLELVCNYSTPVLLQVLLKAMGDLPRSRNTAVTYAVLTLVARLVAAQSAVFSLWFQRRSYERSRGEMITMLFEKTLNRKVIGLVDEEKSKPDTPMPEDSHTMDEQTPLLGSQPTQNPSKATWITFFWDLNPFGTRHLTLKTQPASMGTILNLMRNDVYEVAQRFWEFQSLINKPLGLILSIILIWRLVGWTCLLGIAIVLAAQVVNALLARILLYREKLRRQATDERLQQTSQYIEAIRHLRWYGWQSFWLSKIYEIRQTELNLWIVTYMFQVMINFTNFFASGALPVATFYAYTALAGQQLRVDIAFPALQLFLMMQNELREVPNLIRVLLNAYVAVDRIERFMREPDQEEVVHESSSVELKSASFAWPGMTAPVLHDLTLSFPPGLTVVYGEVASGKTALLQALLGELDLHGGELLRPQAPIGYCAQTPWLQSMTIRDNILFSQSYDPDRYRQTIDACALLPDFKTFEQGDLSPIGENGIGLSGGQKARVALARAVYSQADILLLDDPLSALDHQTAEFIVARCLRGSLLKGRTVVLVTHRVDLCAGISVQQIELQHGRASASIGLNDETKVSTHEATSDHSKVDAGTSNAIPEKFEDEEFRAHGGVQASMYWEYVKAGRLRWWVLATLLAILYQVLVFGQSWFLKEWGEAYKEPKEGFSLYAFIQGYSSLLSNLFDRFPDPAVNVGPWLTGLLVIVSAQALSACLGQVFVQVLTYVAGKRMFKEVMEKVSNTAFRFYDVTPIGRLMNRLTSDIGTIDGNISMPFLRVIMQVITWIISLIVIAGVTPLFLAFSLALTIGFVLIFLRFLPTSQSLRRLEMVSLTPLMSNFGALLAGLTTVRAFRAQPEFQSRVIRVVDAFQKMDHFYWSVQAWLMYRFDTLSAFSTFLLTILAVFSGLSSGLTAFVLIAAGNFVEATHSLCRQYGQLQLSFVSVERIVELLRLEPETKNSAQPTAWWPSTGSDIAFEDVTIRYAPRLPPALKNITLRLKGGVNTAIVGRTGSGKSTLASALLATVLPESGRILIDGVDIAHCDRQALRSRVTFLAQDPILFPGTLRHNLDPTEVHSDTECKDVLARIGKKYNWTLETAIDVGGRNLSQGQRQIVGLARAILRRSSIIIMDEATASIDLDTAWDIQRLLREEVKGSTVITIAHRASAVRDAAECVVLADGKVLGQGKPDEVDTLRDAVVSEDTSN